MSETFEEHESEDILSAVLRVTETVKNADSYDELASALALRYAAREDFDRAVEVADTINDPYTQERTIADIAVKSAAAGHEDGALELVDSLEDFSHQTTALSQLAVAHAAAGEFDRAVELASGMEDNSSTLAEIAAQCATAGDFERALDITETLDLPLYRALALARIADAFLKAGRTDEATELLTQARDETLEIDTDDERASTRAEIALRLAEAGQAEQAAEVFTQAIEDAELAQDPYRETTLAQIAVSHARLKQYDMAVAVTEKINDVYVAADTLANLATIERAEEGREADALQLLNDAYELLKEDEPEVQKEEVQRWRALATVAVRYAEFGEHAQALKATESIGSDNDKSRALVEIALRSAEAGDADAALRTARAIDDDNYRVNALLQLSRALISTDATSEAGFTSLLEAVRHIEQLERPVERVFGLSAAANIYAEAGRKEQTTRLLRQALTECKQITNEHEKASALLSIADAYAKTGDEPDEKAKEILWEISAV